jgi:tetratricopeptide (TPR) repeat protein
VKMFVHRFRLLLVLPVACFLTLSLFVLSSAVKAEETGAGTKLGPAQGPQRLSLPTPALGELEETVQAQIREAMETARAKIGNPGTSAKERGEAFWELGLVYHAYDLTGAAEECYRRAIGLDQSRYEWYYCLAYLLQSEGKFEEALQYYRSAQSLRADSPLIFVRIGECYQNLGRPAEARQAFETALQLNPGGPAVRARLGELALQEKRYEEAVALLGQVLKEQPGANKLHYPLAMAYRGLGKTEEARRHLAMRGTVGIQPPDPLLTTLKKLARGSRTLIQRGKIAYAAGRYAEATEAFRQAVEAAPDNAAARIDLGGSLAKEEKYDEAIAELREALRLAPDNGTAHFNLGSLFAYFGDYEAAVGHLKTAVESDPQDARARLLLAEVLRKQSRLSEAFEQYKSAVRLDPSLVGGWLEMADLLVLAGQHREALGVLEEAHRRLPLEDRISLVLSRHLSGSPERELRNGQRALDLALQSYEKVRGHEQAAAVASAYAELDLCKKAEEWQQRGLDLATASQMPQTILERQKRILAHYRTQKPCRAPWRSGPRSGKPQ